MSMLILNFLVKFLNTVVIHPSRAQTLGAVAVEDDLMPADMELLGREGVDASYAADEVEEFLALLAEKEMMVMPRGRLVVRCHAGDFHHAYGAVRLKLLERAIDRGHPEAGQFLLCFDEDFLRRQGTVAFFDDLV